MSARVTLPRRRRRIRTLVDAYEAGERASGRFDGGGVARLEPELPFLFVYRPPGTEDAGTARLLAGEAAVVLAGDDEDAALVLVRAVARAGVERYGAFLVLELWAGAERDRFVVYAPEGEAESTVRELVSGLETAPGHGLGVSVERRRERGPPGRAPLIDLPEADEAGILLLGLAVAPAYRSPDGEALYPIYLRSLRAALSGAFRKAAFDFLRVQTSADVSSYRALGPRLLDERALEADRELAEIEESFPFLLLVSPVDQREAWERFQDGGFSEEPEFRYRLLPVDPDLLKRRLFAVPLEEVDDPAMSFLLRDKREELDRQLSLLLERNTPAFRPGSVRLYGTVDDELLTHARDVLDRVPRPRRASEGRVDAHAFAERAREEFRRYADRSPAFRSSVEVRPDVSGLMVSKGQLLVGDDLDLPAARVEALLHHEVGTHVLTWCNGEAQPLRQLCTGLAGYDELQEGLAVLAEHLVGGLDAARLRVLAARVVAAASVQGGATFVESFRALHHDQGLSPAGAFSVVARVHACGGFTRDAIYLRGLVRLLRHLREGGAFEELYLGKIALRHLDVVAELRERGVLRPPPHRPRFFDTPAARRRLETLRGGVSLVELVA